MRYSAPASTNGPAASGAPAGKGLLQNESFAAAPELSERIWIYAFGRVESSGSRDEKAQPAGGKSGKAAARFSTQAKDRRRKRRERSLLANPRKNEIGAQRSGSDFERNSVPPLPVAEKGGAELPQPRRWRPVE